MTYKVFYSWQSDLPNNTNRRFIQEAVENAVQRISSDSYEIDFVVDRDTSGVPGSPNISETIQEKIKQCDIFYWSHN